MRIVFDQADYNMRNKGNVALLITALERCRQLFPGASLEVITSGPYLLKYYCPRAHPVSLDGRHDWSGGRGRVVGWHLLAPRWAWRFFFEAREALPEWSARTRLWRGHATHLQNKSAEATLEAERSHGESRVESPSDRMPRQADLQQALAGADLLVATGGGYLCDSDKPRALNVLARLEGAVGRGTPTVMVGQGVGPMSDQGLRGKAAQVLPKVDAILVREARVAPGLLMSLGVPPDRIVIGGDDAVELAYRNRRAAVGDALGISVRLAHYTDVGRSQLEVLRPALHHVATELRARMLGIPISCAGHEADQEHLAALARGYPDATVSRWRFDSPEAIARLTSRCRVVVAGAFHAGVFALAQGIPVVALVRSDEYKVKFEGLSEQFETGCQVLRLDDPALVARLEEAVRAAWDSAPHLRAVLLDAAVRQIELNRRAYRQGLSRITFKRDALDAPGR